MSTKTSSSTSSSKGAIKKTIIRNTEVPLKVTKNRRSVIKEPESKKCENNQVEIKESKKKFHTPELNTLLELKERLDKINLTEHKKIESVSQLTPKTRSVFNHEVTKRLNFPLDKQIYKDLIPINVNDSVLMLPEKRKPIKKKYMSKSKKDPIPELSDFLKPIEPLEHIIPLHYEPDPLRKPENDNFQDFVDLRRNYHPEY